VHNFFALYLAYIFVVYMMKELSCNTLLPLFDPQILAQAYLPYPREKGPMGGALYIGSKLGGGPIFQVSVSQLDAKERPGKLPTRST
jgi:hypothetical protein